MLETLKYHLRPFQKPYPPIGIAGLTPRSDTLKFAGERGFMPLSITLSESYLKTHWQAVLDGAEKSGKTPSRDDWRIAREVYIAETDKEARDKAINGMLGRVYREYLLPLFKSFGMISLYKHHPEVPDSDVTIEYLAEYCWLVGSPKTIVDKLGAMHQETGGFGCLRAVFPDFGRCATCRCRAQAGFWSLHVRAVSVACARVPRIVRQRVFPIPRNRTDSKIVG